MTGINVGGQAPFVAPPVIVDLLGAQGGAQPTSDLYTVDSSTGGTTSIGAIGFAMTGLAFRPSDGVLFGVTSNQSASNPRSLVTVDPVTGAGTLVGALGVSNGLADITFRSDDTLFGYTPSTRTLYTVNTTTGAATQVSSTAIPTSGQGYGIAFDSSDVLYVFPKGAAGVYYIVDPATGGLTVQPTLTGSIGGGPKPVSAACFDSTGVCWAMYIGQFDYWLATIDVGASTVAEVAATLDEIDALVVDE
jgi:hypothetical protein